MTEILGYLGSALTLFNLGIALLGVVLGTIIGALPGLSATMAVAVLVPFTFTMAPASGLIALGAIYTGAIYGGAFAAILVNTPGTPSSIATTFDGHPMAKKGDGGLAVTLATLASVAGGLVGGLFLLFLAPPLANIALAFGPSEYFWLALFGLTLIATLSTGNMVKGLMGGCLGLLMSAMGVAVVGGDVRYTLNMPSLLGGIDVTSALIGLYCVPVLIDLVANKTPHLNVLSDNHGMRMGEALALIVKGKFNLLRSSLIGTGIGILPGAGGSIAGLIAYSEARRSSKNSSNFGSGEPDGVVAVESANNATVGGGFIPTLVLGIPGTPPDAIILGGLLVQGIKIGPSLFTDQVDIVYTFMFGLIIATLLMLPAGLLIGKYVYRFIVKVPKELLVPVIALLTVIGSFAIHSNPHDTVMMVVLGILAWLLEKRGFSASPIVLGLVLGQIAEQGFVQNYLIGSAQDAVAAQFFGRPISLAIVICIALTLLWPIYAHRRNRGNEPATLTAVDLRAAENGFTRKFDSQQALSSLVSISVAAYFWFAGHDLSPMGAVFPKTIAFALACLSIVLLIQAVRVGAPALGKSLDRSTSLGRQMLLILVRVLWALGISKIGFFSSSFAAFVALTFIASFEKLGVRQLLGYFVIAVSVIALFYVLMVDVLVLRMPQGLLV
jgi:putative tricarboxylic transport membrane protein